MVPFKCVGPLAGKSREISNAALSACCEEAASYLAGRGTGRWPNKYAVIIHIQITTISFFAFFVDACLSTDDVHDLLLFLLRFLC
jgi:hypothetical protein